MKMQSKRKHFIPYMLNIALMASLLIGCVSNYPLLPDVESVSVPNDPDDAAVWINPMSPQDAVIYINDKNTNGAIYALNIKGEFINDIKKIPLIQPNNLDAISDINLHFNQHANSSKLSLLFVTERFTHKVRIYTLPSLVPLNQEGFRVFEQDSIAPTEWQSPMGIAVSTNQTRDTVNVFVSRKNGPFNGYLAHYQLTQDPVKKFNWSFVQNLGSFSGLKEIESLCFNHTKNELLYSDEGFGIRSISFDKKQNDSFGLNNFKADVEGICIIQNIPRFTQGLICVSDQQRNRLNLFNLDDKKFVGFVDITATETDGIEFLPVQNKKYPYGLLIVMNDKDHNFHYYSVKKLLKSIHFPDRGSHTKKP